MLNKKVFPFVIHLHIRKYKTNIFQFLHFRSFSTSNQAFKKVGVIGGGQMGMGIAQTASQVGKMEVIVMDNNKEALEKSISSMKMRMESQVKKGKLDEAVKEATLSKIKTTTNLSDLKDVDIVVEAVVENLEVKKNIFRDLCGIVSANTILASNTSSISITKIAASTDRPQQVAGVHFMNPVPVMKLVEIIPGLKTSDETNSRVVSFAQALGKTTTVSKDRPGFIANRILIPYINEAVFALSEGIATKEDIDTTMKLGTNVPMGPLTLADFIGSPSNFFSSFIVYPFFFFCQGKNFHIPQILRDN